MGLSIAKLWLPPGCQTPREVAYGGAAAIWAVLPRRGVSTAHPTPRVRRGTLCIALSDSGKGWNTHKATAAFSEEPLG